MDLGFYRLLLIETCTEMHYVYQYSQFAGVVSAKNISENVHDYKSSQQSIDLNLDVVLKMKHLLK